MDTEGEVGAKVLISEREKLSTTERGPERGLPAVRLSPGILWTGKTRNVLTGLQAILEKAPLRGMLV